MRQRTYRYGLISIFIGGLLVGAICILFQSLNKALTSQPPDQHASPVETGGAAKLTEPVQPIRPQSALAAAGKKEPRSELNPEAEATVRMVAAHRQLRSPEIANATSAQNRRILETMVRKALQTRNSSEAPSLPQN